MTHHEGAGPAHGPAHRGDLGSAEPGGFDEFDHQASATPELDGDTGPDVAGPTDPSEPAAEHGPAVVSDGTAAEGDDAEPFTVADVVGDTAYAALAAERLEDLRRLQAEYVNYKKRVDRDRAVARELGISHVLESMLPVLDEIHLAREHGDLADGPAATIVDKLEAVLARLGIERFGLVGEDFDPAVHEALMHLAADLHPDATTTTVVKVLQPGYRLGERVVRPARVAVADPQ
ncbi:MAG: nucleotide exchange factor GrpE [Dermatophilaceae bacterium]